MSEITRALRLADQPALARHPGDGWLAEPYSPGPLLRPALQGLIRALCPPPPAPSSPELFDAVERYVLGFLPYMPRPVALGFRAIVLLLDWSPLWLGLGFRRLQKLSHARAAAVLSRLDESRSSLLRTQIVAVRGVVLSGYFDQDTVHEALDYAPVPFIGERIALRRDLLARRGTAGLDGAAAVEP